jgi:hypothetical protein
MQKREREINLALATDERWLERGETEPSAQPNGRGCPREGGVLIEIRKNGFSHSLSSDDVRNTVGNDWSNYRILSSNAALPRPPFGHHLSP